MTKSEIDNLESGRNLALVAEKPYRCRRCGSHQFKRYKSTGFRYCPPCDKDNRDRWRKNNIEKDRLAKKAYMVKNYKRFFEYRRKWALRKRYGITLAEYNHLLSTQDGRCGICRKKPQKNRRLTVDHDHRTDKVRGLLCDSCNIGLEKFNDSTLDLYGAIRYLDNHEMISDPLKDFNKDKQ